MEVKTSSEQEPRPYTAQWENLKTPWDSTESIGEKQLFKEKLKSFSFKI